MVENAFERRLNCRTSADRNATPLILTELICLFSFHRINQPLHLTLEVAAKFFSRCNGPIPGSSSH